MLCVPYLELLAEACARSSLAEDRVVLGGERTLLGVFSVALLVAAATSFLEDVLELFSFSARSSSLIGRADLGVFFENTLSASLLRPLRNTNSREKNFKRIYILQYNSNGMNKLEIVRRSRIRNEDGTHDAIQQELRWSWWPCLVAFLLGCGGKRELCRVASAILDVGVNVAL